MNTMTKPSPYPYHHVLIDAKTDAVTLCVTSGEGDGSYDYWRVDKVGHERVRGVVGEHKMTDYWMDYTSTEVGRNIYNVLDFYVKIEDNVVELNKSQNFDLSFCSDDIPF